MSYPTAAQILDFFEDIGLLIAQYNDYGTTFDAAIRVRTNEKITQIPNSATDERLTYLQAILSRDVSDRGSITGLRSALASEVMKYIETEGQRLYNTPSTRTVKNVLKLDVVEAMNKCGTPQTIEANVIECVKVEGDDEGTAGIRQTSGWKFQGAIEADNTDAAGRLFAKLWFDNPNYKVEVYDDSGLTSLVAAGSRADAAGAVVLAEENVSGLTGDVTIAYTDSDDSNIILYPPVQKSGATGNGVLTKAAMSVTQYCKTEKWELECVNADTEGSETWRISGSLSGRLSNATTAVAYTDETRGFVFTISAGGTGYAVGDKFYFWTFSEDDATIMTFMRNVFGIAEFPTSGSPTIADSIAE